MKCNSKVQVITRKYQAPRLVLAAWLSDILLLYHPIALLHTMPIDLPLPIHPPLSHTPPNLNPTHKDLTHKLQAGDEDAQQARDDEMADAGPDVQPAALVADEPEEVHGEDVADGDDEHEETAGRDAEAAVQDAEVGADDGEGDDDLEDEEGALREGVEDGEEAVDRVEGEGGQGGDVARGEEGGLEEVEEEEGDAGVGEGEGPVLLRGGGGG